MWPVRSYNFAHLTRLPTIKRKFKYTSVEHYAFEKNKRIVAQDTLLNYPGFNETIKIHTNASAFQLREFIRQKGRPTV